MGRFKVKLSTPAKAIRPAGKGKGRSKGYRPSSRTRLPVVKNVKSSSDRASMVCEAGFGLLFSIFKVYAPYGALFCISKLK